MSKMRTILRALVTPVGDDQVDVIMSTAALARDGHVLLPQGCQLENYRHNPIVLWGHDPDHPIGNAENVTVGPDTITARITFAPLGISRKADEIRGLMKSGVIRAVSVGFDPIEMEPLDPKKPRGGQRISAWEMLELSAVSVPSDTGALVTARSNGENTMPDAATPETLPAARVLVSHTPLARGLYQVAQLCYLFEELGWHVDMATYEAAIEKDASMVPGMLADVLHGLGNALLAMTQEEVAEALAGYDVEPEAQPIADVVLTIEDRAHIAAGTSPATRAFRRGLAHAKHRAGKTLSADTIRCLKAAQDMHGEAMDLQRSAIRKHKDANNAIAALLESGGTPDSDTTDVQTSDGAANSGGSENERSSADFRRRQADMMGLATTA